MSNDSSVIERSLGTPSEFGELFVRHAAPLHRYVARRAGESVADDVTSETFLIAFERRSRYDLTCEDARPWLLGIATNLLHRHRVAQARSLRALGRIAPERDLPDDVDRVAAAVDARDRVRGLACALRSLSSDERDCLLLLAWADLSYEEIARALEIPIGTVRSRLHRARRAIRAVTDAEPEEDDRGRAAAAANPA